MSSRCTTKASPKRACTRAAMQSCRCSPRPGTDGKPLGFVDHDERRIDVNPVDLTRGYAGSGLGIHLGLPTPSVGYTVTFSAAPSGQPALRSR